MKEKKRNSSAISALFPDLDSLENFIDDNEDSERIDSIIRFLVKHKIIKKPDIRLLREFIEKYNDTYIGTSSIENISFGKLIEKRKNFLGLDDSIRNITKSINAFIESEGIILPPVNHGMFTRLKNETIDTAHKRDAIRCFSLWLGYNYPDLIGQWNFRTLLQAGQKSLIEKSFNEGVRISFTIEGLGDDIRKAFDWLKKQINETISYLELDFIRPKQIVSLFPTIYVNIHKKAGPCGDHRLYDQALRDAMALAHQISIKSSLYFGGNREQTVIIAIAAGEYLRLEALIQGLQSDRLKQTAMIRVSTFARLCARTAGIKIVFYDNEEKIQMPNGQTVSVWFLKCFWTNVYYNFVQELLDPQMLPDPKNPDSVERFATELYFQNQDSHFKALSALYQSQQNDLLVLEIAKTLASKQLFQEANTVLSSILSNNPHHIVARCFRMLLFLNMALKQKKLNMFEEFYSRAITENLFILDLDSIVEPEVFCESGLVYLGGALQYFVFMRNKDIRLKESVSENRLNKYHNTIIELLKNARTCFEKGVVVSSTGADNRCVYWLVYSRAIIAFIDSNPDILKSTAPLKDKENLFYKIGEEFFTFLGWRDERFDDAYYFSRFGEEIRKYQNAVLFRTYVPNVYYSVASIIFDFSPVLTVGILKLILSWLETSKKLSKQLETVHSTNFVTDCFGQIISIEKFIRPVENAISLINEIAGKYLEESDDVEIDMNIFDGVKLLLFNFDGLDNSLFKISNN